MSVIYRFQEHCDSVKREVMYHILIEFCIPVKPLRLIKMCLSETCSKVCIGKKSVWCISYSEWSKTRRCFIAITFWLWFRICHQEDPRKSI